MKSTMCMLLVLLTIGVVIADEAKNETETNEYLLKKRHYIRTFDADADGKLNAAEFEAMTKSEFEKKQKTGYQEVAAKRFKFKDVDKDGFVTVEELILSLVKTGNLPPEAALGITNAVPETVEN